MFSLMMHAKRTSCSIPKFIEAPPIRGYFGRKINADCSWRASQETPWVQLYLVGVVLEK